MITVCLTRDRTVISKVIRSPLQAKLLSSDLVLFLQLEMKSQCSALYKRLCYVHISFNCDCKFGNESGILVF